MIGSIFSFHACDSYIIGSGALFFRCSDEEVSSPGIVWIEKEISVCISIGGVPVPVLLSGVIEQDDSQELML